MRYIILTLFPEVIMPYCESSILGRAIKSKVITVETVNPRDFTQDIHRKVDDTPYGGGPGMVMQCDPIVRAWESLELPEKTQTILMAPSGTPLSQPLVCNWAKDLDCIVIICGHYEGIDARVLDCIPNITPVCVGDVVLTGGELPALTIIDAVSRHLPGVLGKDHSVEEESFMTENLLEGPHYTRPQEYRGHKVPDILLSGNHAEIAKWRHQQGIEATKKYRS